MRSRTLGNIMRISRCCNTYRKQQLIKCPLNPSQHIYISYACRFPGCSQEQFASAICIDKTTVAHQLNRLEEAGYIERRVSPEDGRCRRIYPTKQAFDVYPEIHGAFEAFTEHILDGLTQEDRAELSRLTEILYQNALRLIQDTKTGG